MAFKFVALLAFVSVASAGLLPAAQELVKSEGEYNSHPSYTFNYEVQDANTGDFKSQSESREGDVVQGQYTLHDADGYRRVVDYSSDADNGFRAHVRREPLNAVALVQKTVEKPVLYTQPPAFLKTSYVHAPSTVQIAPAAAHFVHAAPAAAFVKTVPTTVLTHHHAPAVVHSSFVTPHFQYAI